MGCNCPAKAMPFDGMVQRYFHNLYRVTYARTNKCLQSGFTDYALCVAHNTSCILATISNFSRSLRLRFGRTLACAQERSSMSSSFRVGLVWSELLLDENCTPSSYVQFPFHSRLLCHEHYLSFYLFPPSNTLFSSYYTKSKHVLSICHRDNVKTIGTFLLIGCPLFSTHFSNRLRLWFLGPVWSQNDVIMSCMRLTATSNCSPHPS
jgi:hypothetical protein